MSIDVLNTRIQKMLRCKKLTIRNAQKEDMEFIKSCILRFKLDDENINWHQFIVTELDGKIVGFGRVKPYRSCHELGCVGVLEEYRVFHIGTTIIRKLIEIFPSDDVWITTDLVRYFEKLGFRVTEKGSTELIDKIYRVCKEKCLRDNVKLMVYHRKVDDKMCTK